MKKLFVLNLMLTVLLLFLSCEKESSLAPEQNVPEGNEIVTIATAENAELVARKLIAMSDWPLDPEAEMTPERDLTLQQPLPECISYFQRQVIVANIVHYSFRVRVGPGEYDVIGIHRVVKEKQPCRPIRTAKALFLQHGDYAGFEDLYIPGVILPSMPIDFGIAVYLAENDVDIWGIDQAWMLIPEGASNFSFMADWGLQRQIDDLDIALAVARFGRAFTGNGFKKILLSGYSSGGVTGFAFLNEETQKPPGRRQVKGYIPVDLCIKIDDEPFRQYWLNRYTALMALFNSGVYQENVPWHLVSNLARTDPDGASPILAGLTNLQVALFFAAGPIFEVIPFHYTAGVWEGQLPVDLQYWTIDQWLDFLEATAYYEPYLFQAEFTAVMCDAEDLPFDDYFSQIEVPIFNVAAAGGLGNFTAYGLTLLGSTDITSLNVRLLPAGQELIDFAHVDIFTGYNAETLVWQPILDWIEAHSN